MSKRWSDLSMKERAAYIRIGVANGYKDIDDIRKKYLEYNTFEIGGNKESTDNPFEYGRNQFERSNMSESYAKELNDSVTARNFSFPPEAIAYILGTESGYNTTIGNSNSTAKGLFQLTKTALRLMYGVKEGDAIYNKYVDNTRSLTDLIHDGMVYLLNIENKLSLNNPDRSPGRLKANFLAPNSAMTSKISDAVWKHSLTDAQKKALVLGKSTYNDLSNIYNKGYAPFLEGYNSQKPTPKSSRRNRKDFGGSLYKNTFGEGGELTNESVDEGSTERRSDISSLKEIKEAEPIKEFFSTFADSPGAKRILNRQEKELKELQYANDLLENEIKPAKDALESMRGSKDSHIFLNPNISIDDSYHEAGKENRNSIIGGKKSISPELTDYPRSAIIAHEMAHDNFDTYYSEYGQAHMLRKNNNTKINMHDELNNEKRADIEALRYLLFENGIFDQRLDSTIEGLLKNKEKGIGSKATLKEGVQPNHIQQLRELYPNIRPLQQMDNKTAAWMLNHVVQNGISNNPNITALGGPLVQVANEFEDGGPELNEADILDSTKPIWYYSLTEDNKKRHDEEYAPNIPQSYEYQPYPYEYGNSTTQRFWDRLQKRNAEERNKEIEDFWHNVKQLLGVGYMNDAPLENVYPEMWVGPLVDLGINAARKAIVNTITKRAIGKEITKAAENIPQKTLAIESSPKTILFDNVNVPTSTVEVFPKDISLANQIQRFNNWAEYYGYNTIPENATLSEAERIMKSTFDRHNTFFRGVQKPYLEEDISEVNRVLGPNATEDEILKYAATTPRAVDDVVFISPASNAAIYGSNGKTAIIRRKYELGNNPKTWINDADFDILYHGNTNNPVGSFTFPWSYRGNGAVENELLAPRGTLDFVGFVPENGTIEFIENNGSLNKYLGNETWYDGVFENTPLRKPKFANGGPIVQIANKYKRLL